MDWKTAFRDYVANLESAWPADRVNQVGKLEKFLAAAGKDAGLSRDGVVEQIIDIAERRIASRPRTVFLISCGSSGSHWLEAMLADDPGYVACGEVYLPRDLARESNAWPVDQRATFIDCVHLAHLARSKVGLADAKLINSAHLSGWIMARMMGEPQTRVLLVRNPVDIVISRTFRKDDYRRFSGRDAADDVYLAKNIEFVNTFYRSAAERGAEVVVKYEDLRRDGADALGRVTQALADPRSPAQLEAVVRKYSAENQSAAGAPRLSNYYRGPEVQLPDGIRERIAERIDPAARGFGY